MGVLRGLQLALGLQRIAQAHEGFDAGDDAGLFGEGWEWKGLALEVASRKSLLPGRAGHDRFTLFKKSGCFQKQQHVATLNAAQRAHYMQFSRASANAVAQVLENCGLPVFKARRDLGHAHIALGELRETGFDVFPGALLRSMCSRELHRNRAHLNKRRRHVIWGIVSWVDNSDGCEVGPLPPLRQLKRLFLLRNLRHQLVPLDLALGDQPILLRPNLLQQHARRFIGRVLRHQLALHGQGQDEFTQTRHAAGGVGQYV